MSIWDWRSYNPPKFVENIELLQKLKDLDAEFCESCNSKCLDPLCESCYEMVQRRLAAEKSEDER